MSEGLGLLITPDHEATINSLDQVPASFCTIPDGLPDSWESPVNVLYQGSTSSCAGHAEAANFSHRQFVETGEVINYSAWFCYLTAQKRGGFYGSDRGTSIKSTIDAATLDGACLESLCKRPERYQTVISQEAVSDASKHKHHGSPVDLRDWNTLMSWLYDHRSAVIGTTWYGGQSTVRGIESLSLVKSGSFLGYHARALIGWAQCDGEASPRVLNSHGSQWGTNGRATISREAWNWWLRDANFVALGFTDIDERVPKRRDLSQVSYLSGKTKSIV